MVLTPQNKIQNILEDASVTELAVGGASGSVYSQNFVLPKNHSFGFEFVLEGATAANIEVYLEQGNEQLTDAEQGSANDNYVVPDDQDPLGTLDAFDTAIMVGSPAVSLFGRLKFVLGTGNNVANKLTRIRMVTTENG